MSINKVVLIGNLAREPESRKAGDSSVCRLVLAVNDPYGKDEKVSYFDVEAWGKTAELCQKFLQKGRQVAVDGRLVQDRWDKDGETKTKVYVKADNVQFIGSKDSGSKDSPTQTSEKDTKANSKSQSKVAVETEDEDIPF
jgi:single-strand DNA-binding protein